MPGREILVGVIIFLVGGSLAAGTWQAAPPSVPRDGGLIVPRDASIGSPYGVTVDSSDNVYFTSSLNDVFKLTPGGELTLIAGGSRAGFSGDGGPAPSAELNLGNAGVGPASGVAVDTAGNLYIADTSNHRIRRVSGEGVITTIAGTGTNAFSGDGGPAVQAQLAFPAGLAFDRAGNLYVSDRSNNRIRKIGRDGIITTVAGSGTYGYRGDGGPALAASLSGPTGIAFDERGNLYIADTGNDGVRRVSPAGIITTVVTAAAETDASSSPIRANFGSLSSGATGPGGVVIITGSTGVWKLSADGLITRLAKGSEEFSGDGGAALNATVSYPVGAAMDRAGNVFIADRGNYRIRRIGTNGLISTVAGTGFSEDFSGDGGPAVNARLNLCSNCQTEASDLAMDSAGNLYVADTGNHRIRRISADGVITTVAGDGTRGYSGDGGPATKAQLVLPQSIAVDRTGNLFIAEPLTHRVRKVTPNGTITTVPDTDKPMGLAVDDEGSLYVAENRDERVRKFSVDGTVSTIASLNSPKSVAVDSSGTVYVTDGGGSIRKIGRDGIITTLVDVPRQPAIGGFGRIALDRAQNLYGTQRNWYRVSKIESNGSVAPILGRSVSVPAGSAWAGVSVQPRGIVVDAAGNLYIADSGGRWRTFATWPLPAGWRELCASADCILKLAPDGTVTKVAGGGEYGVPRHPEKRPECLIGTWKENPPTMGASWTFEMVGNDLQISRPDGRGGFVSGIFKRSGDVWIGDLVWGNRTPWWGIKLMPSSDCREVRTSLQQLTLRR